MDPEGFKIKMQAKQLEAEARRHMKQAMAERNKAKAELKRGNRPAAQMHANTAVRYEQQANQLLQNAGAITGYAVDMQAAKVTADTAKTMGVATHGMEAANKQVNLTQLQANRSKMDAAKQSLGTANNMIVGEDPVAESGADELLAVLEAENDAALLDLGIPEGQYAPGRATAAGSVVGAKY